MSDIVDDNSPMPLMHVEDLELELEGVLGQCRHLSKQGKEAVLTKWRETASMQRKDANTFERRGKKANAHYNTLLAQTYESGIEKLARLLGETP